MWRLGKPGGSVLPKIQLVLIETSVEKAIENPMFFDQVLVVAFGRGLGQDCTNVVEAHVAKSTVDHPLLVLLDFAHRLAETQSVPVILILLSKIACDLGDCGRMCRKSNYPGLLPLSQHLQSNRLILLTCDAAEDNENVHGRLHILPLDSLAWRFIVIVMTASRQVRVLVKALAVVDRQNYTIT